jgi:hypothetical protein
MVILNATSTLRELKKKKKFLASLSIGIPLTQKFLEGKIKIHES